jgi:RAT1-interacting protein
VFRIEETGHGDILSDEFVNWRIKLGMPKGEADAEASGT